MRFVQLGRQSRQSSTPRGMRKLSVSEADEQEGVMLDNLRTMILKAPGILTFLVSIILALGVLYARYFGSDVPFSPAMRRNFTRCWPPT